MLLKYCNELLLLRYWTSLVRTKTRGQSNLAKVASNAPHRLHAQDSVAVAAMELGVIWWNRNCVKLEVVWSNFDGFSAAGPQLAYMTYEVVAVVVFCLVDRRNSGSKEGRVLPCDTRFALRFICAIFYKMRMQKFCNWTTCKG